MKTGSTIVVFFLAILALGILLSTTSNAYADSVQVVMAKGSASNTNCGDQCYAPSTVSIAVGNSVVWKNSDTTSHTATASDGSFDTSLVPAGASASIAFNTAGTYQYSCLLHPWAKGTVIVGDSSVPLTPTTPDNTPTQTSPPTETQTGTHLIIAGKIDPTYWNNNNQMTVTLQLAQIFDNGKSAIIRLTQVQPQPDGSFGNDFYAMNLGNYKIIANYGSAKAETAFTLDGKSTEMSLTLPTLQRPVETKKGSPVDAEPIKREQSSPPESQPTSKSTFEIAIIYSTMTSEEDSALADYNKAKNYFTLKSLLLQSSDPKALLLDIQSDLRAQHNKNSQEFNNVKRYNPDGTPSNEYLKLWMKTSVTYHFSTDCVDAILYYLDQGMSLQNALNQIDAQMQQIVNDYTSTKTPEEKRADAVAAKQKIIQKETLTQPQKVTDQKKVVSEKQKESLAKLQTQTKQQITTPVSKPTTEKAKSNSVVPQIAKQVTKQVTNDKTDNLKKTQEIAKQKALEKAKQKAKSLN